MSRKLLILLSAVLLLISGPAHSQSPDQVLPAERDTTSDYCHFDKMMEALDQNPAHRQMRRDVDQMVRDYMRDNPMDERGGNEIVIPVVFHVIHQGYDIGYGENLKYEQIQWQVNALNAAFSRNYPEYNNQDHDGSAVNAHIRFCLAGTPAGTTWTNAAEPGVMRYDGISDDVLDPTVPDIDGNNFAGVMPLVNLTHPTPAHFPFNSYLNIWSVRSLGNAKAVGIPPQAAGNYYPLDGIITCYTIIGDNTVIGNDFSMDVYSDEGKILAHEVGHYLDLLHTFSPNYQYNLPLECEGFGAAGASSDACDAEGDHICDTPPCQVLNSVNQLDCSWSLNTCLNTNDYPAHNYMTYMDDSCLNAFTQGQSDWMNAVLNNNLQNRFPLWQPSNLVLTGVSCGECFLTANIDFIPELPCPGAPVDFKTPTGNAFCATQWDWQFPGSIQGQSNQQNPQNIVYPVAGSYTATLTASDGITAVQQQLTVNVSDRVATITGPVGPVMVCSGSMAPIEFYFSGGMPPYSYTLSDGTVFQTRLARHNHLVMVNDTVTISIVSAYDSVCAAAVSGSVTINSVSCCSELISNGSFTDGNTGFQTDLPYYSGPYGPPQFDYNVGSYAQPPYYGWVAPDLQDFGSGMSFNSPNPAAHTVPYRYTNLWSQQVSLLENRDYRFSYLISNATGAPNGFPDGFVHLKVVIINSGGNEVFSSSEFTPDIATGGLYRPGREYWCQQRVAINTAGMPGGNYTISIRQVGAAGNFSDAWFDFIIDEISLRAEPGVTFTADAGADTASCNCTTGSGPLIAIGSAANGLAPYTYQWYNDAGASFGNSNILAAQCYVHPSHPIPGYSDTYTLVVTDAMGCQATDQVLALSAGATDDLDLTASPSASVCQGQAVIFTATPGFSNYVFMVGNAVSQNNASNTFSYPNLSPGSIVSVSVTSSSGCVLISEPITYTINPPIVVELGADTSVCGAAVITLDAGAGYSSYLWSPGGQTTQTISAGPGNYAATVTDANGCEGSGSIVISSGNGLNPVIYPAGPISLCEGNTVVLDAGTGYGTYLWSPGGETTQFITIDTAGSYSVAVTAAGCSGGSAAVVVTIAPAVSPQIEVNVNQLCVADTFCTYQWMINHTPIPGATSFCYMVSQSAQYSVEIGSCDGCEIKPPVVEAFVSTDEPDFADHISLYPNPTAGTLILELSFNQPEDLVVRLRDVAGRELREAERLEGVRTLRKEISLAEFADGFYFLVLEKQDSRLVKRVMKNGR